MSLPDQTWMIGCGAMGGAVVDGWRRADFDLCALTVIRPSGASVPGASVVTAIPAGEPRLMVLAVKPQKLPELVDELAPHVGGDTIVLSMLAGTSADTLSDAFSNARAIVRMMPNLPVALGQGVTALYSDDADAALRAQIDTIMAPLGTSPWVDSEDDFSAIGAVAGSGPAYLARFVDALAAGGEGLGLDPDLAMRIAVATLTGTGALAEAGGDTMAELAKRVASPKGTTEAGLAVLDADDGLQPLIDRMLTAAIARGQALAAETARAG